MISDIIQNLNYSSVFWSKNYAISKMLLLEVINEIVFKSNFCITMDITYYRLNLFRIWFLVMLTVL